MNHVAPRVYFVVRQTTDWANEAVVRAQLPDRMVPLVDLWDQTFEMPFHIFRQRIKLIAENSRSRVAGAVTADLADVPAGELIVPTDDDDWFSPGLAKSIGDVRTSEHCGYHWPSRFLEVPVNLDSRLGFLRRRLFPKTRRRWLCTSNNYAIINSPDTVASVHRHVQATNWFNAHPANVRLVDVALSVQNRTMASQTSLLLGDFPMNTTRLLRKYRQYVRLYSSRTAAKLPAWSAPYVGDMVGLMQELKPRRR